MPQTGSSSSKIDRKLVERNRRTQMRGLYSRLASHIPPHPSKDKQSLHTLLDQAKSHIKQTEERIEELKRRKELLNGDTNVTGDRMIDGSSSLLVNLRESDSTLEINLTCGLNKKFMLSEVISVLEEEGAEVATTNYSTIGDKVFYIIYSQAVIPRIGIDTSRVHDRLKKLVL